ncbi:MAG: hypothetical protein QOD85_1397, partial [Gaiellaceae bacterium]|nr:hypothetical protein [Gaiellaceae bacterium]
MNARGMEGNTAAARILVVDDEPS